MKGHRTLSASEIVEGLYGAFREFTGNAPQSDDLTVIVVKVK
jgi:serine phosphatase RsbU (regulator of sigma subunit)